MTEPNQRLQKPQKPERPSPQIIQPSEDIQFPPKSLDELDRRSEGEKKREEWNALTNYVLLKAEGDRILKGLSIITALESGSEVTKEDLQSPNFKEAQKVLREWQAIFPNKEIGELAADIKARINNNIGSEVANMTTAGIEAPNGVRFDALEDYIMTLPVAEQLLKGLRQDLEEHPPSTRERARAQHFMADQNIRSPQEGIQRVNNSIQKKKDILGRLGIQVP